MRYEQEFYTSLSLSTKLYKGGFGETTPRRWWDSAGVFIKKTYLNDKDLEERGYYPSYDILNELCVEYAEDIFIHNQAVKYNVWIIMKYLKEADKDGAEEYLWRWCAYNPRNQ